MHYLNVIIFNEEIFSGSMLFSVVAFLKWFTKSSKFEEDFNDLFSWVTFLKWFTKSSKFEGFNDNELL